METTHVFTWEGLGKPRNAVYAELTVTIPQFFSAMVPNVRTIGSYDPVDSTRLYIDGGMISNREVDYFDGSFPRLRLVWNTGTEHFVSDSRQYRTVVRHGDGWRGVRSCLSTRGRSKKKLFGRACSQSRLTVRSLPTLPLRRSGPTTSLTLTGDSVPSSTWSQAGGLSKPDRATSGGRLFSRYSHLTIFPALQVRTRLPVLRGRPR